MLQIVGVGDFNKDGRQDIAVASYDPATQAYGISVLLGNGDGTFHQGAEYTLPTNNSASEILVSDINGDGSLDLVLILENGGGGGVAVLLGNGDGTFQQPVDYSGVPQLFVGVLGDFNHDGLPDVIAAQLEGACVFLGNGNGTFQAGNCTTFSPGQFFGITTGDFNSDGNLDIALTGDLGMAVLFGNGDGTFRPSQTYAAGVYTNSPVAADFNGDGILDLVTVYVNGGSLLTFLGKGDGTFQAPSSYPTAFGPSYLTLSDMNGDGKLDLVVADYAYNVGSVSILLGNGDGTFQTYVDYYGSQAGPPVVSDFNGDGRLDVAVPNGTIDALAVLIQDSGTAIFLSSYSLKFPTQAVGTVSPPKLITITNNGTSAVKFGGITTTANFSQLSTCRTIQPSGSCRVGVYFTPTVQGSLAGYLAISDNGGGSPQLVALSGVATIVQLQPTSVNFGNQNVGTISKSQNVILTNNGNGSLQISEIAIGGADPHDFYQVNACPAKLAAGASCTITVVFHPTATGARSAVLGVADNGGGSPQTVALSGTGT